MATGDVKENEFGKVNSIEDGSYIRMMDAQGNSVQIDKTSFIEAVRAAMPVATTEKNGLMSPIQSKKVDGLLFNFFSNKTFILNTGLGLTGDTYIMFSIDAISSDGYITNATFHLKSIGNNLSWNLYKDGKSDIIVKGFVFNNLGTVHNIV